MSTTTSPVRVIGESSEPASQGGSSFRRASVIVAALIVIAAANVYIFRGFETSTPDSIAAGWILFHLEAAPPPIYATGSVRSRRSARVSPPVAGLVSRVVPDKFSHVRAGEVLIELDCRQSLAALEQARLTLETARVEEAGAREYLDFLEAQAARYKRLREEGLIADSTYREAQSNARKQEFQTQILRKRVEAAMLAVKQDEEQIDQKRIRAPIDGVVTEVAVTPGQFVAPGGTGDQASTLLTITSLTDLVVQLTVDEIDVTRITVGEEIDLKIDALPGKTARATVRQVARSPVPQQPGKPGVTYEVDMDLLKYPPELTVGMSVFASIADVNSPARYLPSAAVQRDSAGCWVWTIEQERLHRQPVEVGEEREDLILLRSGLDQTAAIIYASPDKLRSLVEGEAAPRVE
jgi:HlyD family secretion protein